MVWPNHWQSESGSGNRVQYAKFKVQYRNLLHDRFSGKYREIFQVYNNSSNCEVHSRKKEMHH